MKAISARRLIGTRGMELRNDGYHYAWQIILFHSKESENGTFCWAKGHTLATEFSAELSGGLLSEDLLSKILDMARRRRIRYIPGLWDGSTEGLSPVEILSSALEHMKENTP